MTPDELSLNTELGKRKNASQVAYTQKGYELGF